MAGSNPTPRRSRRVEGLPPLLSSNPSDPSPSPQEEPQQEPQQEQQEQQQEQQQEPNEDNQNADDNQDGPHLSDDLIPANVDADWLGIDLSKNYVINSNGGIIIDRRPSLDTRHDAKWRNDKYHSHKRKIETHVNHMNSNTRAIAMVLTTNSERLGQPRNVATQIFSPILYEPKHIDLRFVSIKFFDLIIAEMEERLRLENETSISADEFNIFLYNFRNKIGTIGNIGNSSLLTAYDESLLQLFSKDNIDEVLDLLSESVRASQNNADQNMK